jgi:hypothetical protein
MLNSQDSQHIILVNDTFDIIVFFSENTSLFVSIENKV